MLDAIAELAGDGVRHVERILGDEIDADAFRADQPGDLLDALQQRLGRFVEQQMRLVEEEDEFRLRRIADFGKLLEQLAQQPQQECGVKSRCGHQLVGGEDADIAAAFRVGAHQIGDVECRLAEEMIRRLLFENQQSPLNGAYGAFRDVPVFCRQLVRALRHIGDQGAQILQVQQRQLFVGGDTEGDVEHALLHIVHFEQARQQERPHFLDRRTDRMSLFAQQIPEDHGKRFVAVIVEADLPGALLQERLRGAGCGKSGKVAFHIGGKDRHALRRKPFRDDLQGDGLARPGRAGDQAMTIGEPQQKLLSLDTFAEKYGVV